MRHRSSLIAALVLLACATVQAQNASQDSSDAAAQTQPAQEQSGTPTPAELLERQQAQRPPESIPTLQANAHLVVLDVTVVDKQGHPVHGLKASDFTLLENGKPQAISSFEEHMPANPSLNPVAARELKLPPNTFSDYQPAPNNSAVNVLLLDALDTGMADQMYLRSQMIKYLKEVPPGTPIAVFLLDTRLHLLQGFSSDPKALQEFASGKHNLPDPPILSGPMTRYIRQMILQQAMQQLARYLGGLPGRKNLIWFTGNIPVDMMDGAALGDPFADSTSFMDTLMQESDVLTLSRVAVYPVDVRGLMTDPAFSAANQRTGPSPMMFAMRNGDQHIVMDQLATATGGKAFYNTNGLKQAIAEVIDTGANYYTLSYSPANRDWNGQYRLLKIELDRAGYELAYRQGYYARDYAAPRAAPAFHRRVLPLPYKTDNPARETPMQIAMDRGAIAPSQLFFKALVTSPGDETKKNSGSPMPKDNHPDKKLMKYPYRAYRVIYAVDARNLRFTATRDGIYHDSIEFVALLYDTDGDLVNLVVYTVQADLDPKVYGNILEHGLDTAQTIAIPAKGNYYLRLGVHDIPSDRIGAVEIPVDSIKLGPAAPTSAQPASAPKH